MKKKIVLAVSGIHINIVTIFTSFVPLFFFPSKAIFEVHIGLVLSVRRTELIERKLLFLPKLSLVLLWIEQRKWRSQIWETLQAVKDPEVSQIASVLSGQKRTLHGRVQRLTTLLFLLLLLTILSLKGNGTKCPEVLSVLPQPHFCPFYPIQNIWNIWMIVV